MHASRQIALDNFALKNVYGEHMTMRLEMEKRILSSFQRAPVLRSEFCGLHTITGEDMTLDFGNSFSDAFEGPQFPGDIHTLTEQKLKL
uniref:Uncharacterized protein n=1 Tax=Arcella intermedia TaxID=1963864 RepID=A0A6B2LVA5_9EUKA